MSLIIYVFTMNNHIEPFITVWYKTLSTSHLMEHYIIGPLIPAIHGIRVASVIAFCLSVCMYVLCICVTNFLILLHYNIRLPLSPNCDVCANEFVARVNLRRHDTSP